MAKVLLVDDDRDLIAMISFAMTRAGLAVVSAHDAPAALTLLEREQPDIAVLDVDLGRSSGFDLLRDVRKRSDLPVIMLTGMGAERDKLRGFELGADDYVTKPFSHHELLARINARLRNQGQRAARPAPAPALLRVGPLELNPAEHAATKGGQPLDLTVTEFRVLQHLMVHAGAVVRTRELMKEVWGFDDPSGNDTVRVAVYRLRRKLEDDPAHPRLLHTVAGVGVMLKPPPEAPEAQAPGGAASDPSAP
jgi:two-component system, OmpR family, response regulator ResD